MDQHKREKIEGKESSLIDNSNIENGCSEGIHLTCPEKLRRAYLSTIILLQVSSHLVPLLVQVSSHLVPLLVQVSSYLVPLLVQVSSHLVPSLVQVSSLHINFFVNTFWFTTSVLDLLTNILCTRM